MYANNVTTSDPNHPKSPPKTSHSNPRPTPPACPPLHLLSLPPEVRNNIYDLLAVTTHPASSEILCASDGTTDWCLPLGAIRPTALGGVSRQTRREYLSVWFAKRWFRVWAVMGGSSSVAGASDWRVAGELKGKARGLEGLGVDERVDAWLTLIMHPKACYDGATRSGPGRGGAELYAPGPRFHKLQFRLRDQEHKPLGASINVKYNGSLGAFNCVLELDQGWRKSEGRWWDEMRETHSRLTVQLDALVAGRQQNPGLSWFDVKELAGVL